MLDIDDFVHIVALSAMNGSAMLVNILYICIIWQKTPKTLSSYSSILFNIVWVDFLTAFGSLIAITSVENVDGRIILSYIGPCSIVSLQLCHLCLVLLLVVSLAYRLWVLTTTTEHRLRQSQKWAVSRYVMIVYSLLNTLNVYLGGSYDAPVFPFHSISVLDLTGGITDNLNARISVLLVLLIYFIGFILLLSMHRRLFGKVTKLRGAEPLGHHMICRSLTSQMLLPLLSVLGASLWLLDVFGILHSSTLQRLITFVTSIFAIASPLVNMYYIPPYRKYLRSVCCSTCPNTSSVITIKNIRESVDPSLTNFSKF